MLAAVISGAYLLGIVLAIDAVMTVRTSQGAIAWAVCLVTFPFLSIPAYWIFGRRKFAGFIEARRENEHEIEQLVATIRSKLAGFVAHTDQRLSIYDAVFQLKNIQFIHSSELELLIDGEATFNSILEGINQARNYVLIEFYIVRDDGLGKRFSQAMIKAAARGVRVYLLYDEIGSSSLAAYCRQLREAGVEVSAFNTRQGMRNRFQLNFRNHRKLVVVDGSSAWIGGHNIGDEYLGLDRKLSPWRDTHIRINGPAAANAQAIFIGDWYWASRQLLELNWDVEAISDSSALTLILPTSPADELDTAELFFTHALNSAKKRIWITAPYFVPDSAIINALQLAALRGVDVRIIVPKKTDNLLTKLAAYFFMEEVHGVGIRFFQYARGFLHQKVMLIDDHAATVGTANFDNRSFRLNFELTVLVEDQVFAEKIEKMLQDDLIGCEPIDPGMFKNKPFWWHLPVRLARLLAPVL